MQGSTGVDVDSVRCMTNAAQHTLSFAIRSVADRLVVKGLVPAIASFEPV
jgi:hypothetical protein